MFSFTLRCSTSKSFYMQRCEQRCYPQAFRLLSWAYRAGGAEGAAATPPPQFVGQTKPVGQYSLHSRAILAYYKNKINFVGNSVNFACGKYAI
jgi:hypothetical protein